MSSIPEVQNPEPIKAQRVPGRFERATDWVVIQWVTLIKFVVVMAANLFIVPLTYLFGLGQSAHSNLKERGLVPKRSPFTLRRYGDTLLSDTVKLELGLFTVVLVMVAYFELFAWSAMWGLTGVGCWWAITLSLIFAFMVVILDRAILTMDDQGGRGRWAVIFGRLALLLGIALVNSIPVELLIFSPEINQIIGTAEKTRVDEIRAAARATELELARERMGSINESVDGQADDVTNRRAVERADLVAGQRADRTDIVRRLEAKGQELADEIGKGLRTGRPGDGPAARSLRAQYAQLEAELAANEQSARQQLVDFDNRTEDMRSGTAKIGLDEQARREAELDSTLQAVAIMPADELARNYGGTYWEPNGFMARFRILESIVNQPVPKGYWISPDRAVVWGTRIVMVFFGLCILLLKFLMVSSETRTYFSETAQALKGNPQALDAVRVRAKNGDREAVRILQRRGPRDTESAVILRELGHNPNHQSVGWSDDVRSMHIEFGQAQAEFRAAYERFEAFFRELCRETVVTNGVQSNLDRGQIRQRSEAEWNRSVRPASHLYGNAESVMEANGVDVPRWLDDPRYGPERGHLWQLGDEMLRVNYGWVNPRPQLSQPVASA